MFNWLKKKQGPPAPDPRFSEELAMRINDAVKANKHTPDIHSLEQRRGQLLFVHCEIMKGHSRSSLIEEHSVPLYRAFTKDAFTHMKFTDGNETFSIAVREKFHTIPHLPILGELSVVLPGRLLELDRYKLNGVHFIRERVKIVIPYRRKDMLAFPLFEEVTASMYVGRPEFWNKQFDGGYKFSAVKGLGKQGAGYESYTYFSKMELDESINTS